MTLCSAEWEREGHDSNDDLAAFKSGGSEPWDTWADKMSGKDKDDEEDEGIKIDAEKARSGMAKEFLLDTDMNDKLLEEQFAAEEEGKVLQKLSEIRVGSHRLERAVGNPKAEAFCLRKPNQIEGFYRMWVSAIDNVCVQNLVGSFRNYWIELACNFGD